MAEAPCRGDPPSRRDQEYKAEQDQVPVAEQNGTRFPSTTLTNRVRMISDATRLPVPLRNGSRWNAGANERSHTDLLLGGQDNQSSAEWLGIERESEMIGYLEALRMENAAGRREIDAIREATDRMRRTMSHINPNASRE